LPAAALLVGSAGAFLLGRTIGRGSRIPVPAAVAVSAVIVLVGSLEGIVSGGTLEGAFGYRHFDGAFFAQGAVAASMVVAMRTHPAIRAMALAAAVGLALATAKSSVAVVVILVGVLGLGAIAVLVRRARGGIVVLALLFAVSVGATATFGATYTGFERWGSVDALLAATSNRCSGPDCSPSGAGSVERAMYEVVTERRVAYWYEALVLTKDHPGTGVGPGRFREESALSVVEEDEPWAHHEFLQQGAETGLPGLVLLLLLFGWAFLRLWAVPHIDAVAALGAVAVAVLGIHATLDYALHFPAAPIAAAGLLGTAVAVPAWKR
jgi:O-antigen ligase